MNNNEDGLNLEWEHIIVFCSSRMSKNADRCRLGYSLPKCYDKNDCLDTRISG